MILGNLLVKYRSRSRRGPPRTRCSKVLKYHQFDAEITAIEAKGGGPGKHQLVKVDGVFCDRQAGSSFTIWAIILPSGLAYLLSAQGPGETDIPLWPRLYALLLKGETGTGDDARDGKDK